METTEKLEKARLTNHARARMKQRLHIKSFNRQKRLARLALTRGELVNAEEDRQAYRILFDNVIYVFALDKSLLTVYPLTKNQGYKRNEAVYEPHGYDEELVEEVFCEDMFVM